MNLSNVNCKYRVMFYIIYTSDRPGLRFDPGPDKFLYLPGIFNCFRSKLTSELKYNYLVIERIFTEGIM